jgi:hypothetical protein
MLPDDYEKKVICPVEENKMLQDMTKEELWHFCISEFGVNLDIEKSIEQLRDEIQECIYFFKFEE